MRYIDGLDGLRAAVGDELGVSDWMTIEQPLIDGFAAITHDDQWIHTDTDRAAHGPYGTTVAHGLLTLSLIPGLAAQVYRVDGVSARVNYGYDRVRFPAVVAVGGRIRDRIHLDSVAGHESGARAHFSHRIELEGSVRPACVAASITHFVQKDER